MGKENSMEDVEDGEVGTGCKLFTDEGVKGCLLFRQTEGDALKVSGVLSTDMWVEPNDAKGKFELHYLGIRETALIDTCENMGGVWPEWFNYEGEEKCALGAAKF